MREFVLALVDGLVQGISEFLPISSSAHLYLVQVFLDAGEDPLGRIVVVHLGTLVGAAWAVRQQISGWIKRIAALSRPNTPTVDTDKFTHVIIASVPVLLVGALAHALIEDMYTLTIVASTTLLFGIVLALALRFSRANRDWESLNFVDAFLAGCAQILALIPGTSRSGICLTALLALGFRPAVAARFTVLMAIPVLGGAVSWLAWQWWSRPEFSHPAADLCAAVVAAITAWAVVRYGLSYLERSKSVPLLWACIAWRLLLGASLLLGGWLGILA